MPEVAALIRSLQSIYPAEHGPAAAELRKLGARALPELVQVVKAGSPGPADRAADLILELGEPAVPALLELLDTPIPYARSTVIRALGRTGSREAVTPLCGLLRDRHEAVRAAAVEALANIGHAEGLPELRRVLRADWLGFDTLARWHIREAIRKLVIGSGASLPIAADPPTTDLPRPAAAPEVDPAQLPRPADDA